MTTILAIKFRVQLQTYFKPHFSRLAFPAIAGTIILFWSILGNNYQSIGIDINETYLDSRAEINMLGLGVYTLLEFSDKNNASEPENYSHSIVNTIQQYKVHNTENTLRPTVILILAESLFDADSIPNITFNKELLSNLSPYKVANLLSPIYGGRTASAEFEVLTGLSSLFIPGDVVPYTAYFNKYGDIAGSLAREFRNNGYYTYAVHANIETYYNRNIAYFNMGFNDFISIEDMELNKNDYLADGLVSDAAFVDQILNILKANEVPVFIFGASLESHSPYLYKYESTDILAHSDIYSENILNEVSSYAQSVYNFDQQMGRLIAHFEQLDKPVLIYIFGDHKPPLKVNELNGCLDNDWQKYQVPLYAYSNYCDVSVEQEWLSMNQIAPEILRKSGVLYNAYFDYIYSLRNNYPVIHKNVIDNWECEELQLYNAIQWDLLFGWDYLLR